MDKKFFVPFDTAKLLKEKGYPQEMATMYYDTFSGGEISLITDRECVSCVVEGNDRHPLFRRLSELYFAAPTYHEVVDWLEGKGIYITTYRVVMSYVQEEDCIKEKLGWKGCTRMELPFDYEDDSDTFPTRKEALNAAILKALEML